MNVNVNVASIEVMQQHAILSPPKYVIYEECRQPGSYFARPTRHAAPPSGDATKSAWCVCEFRQVCLDLHVAVSIPSSTVKL